MRTIGFTDKGQRIELSTKELISILMEQNKGTFCWLWFETTPKMKKTNNPYFDRVKKITKGNILLGCDYSKRVQNETENPEFQAEKNNVGEKLTKCVRYNDKYDRYYLDYEWFEEVVPKSEYKFDGDTIEKQMFQDFMNSYTPNKYDGKYTVTDVGVWKVTPQGKVTQEAGPELLGGFDLTTCECKKVPKK